MTSGHSAAVDISQNAIDEHQPRLWPAAQVPSRVAIESGNGGSVIAPTNPNGFLNIGPYVWIGDAKGILSYLTDPSDPTPLETGIYYFNLNSNWSIDNNVLAILLGRADRQGERHHGFCGGVGPQHGWQEWRAVDAFSSQPLAGSKHVRVSV